MTVSVCGLPAVALLLLFAGCRNNLPAESRDEAVSSGDNVIRVVFELPGDDIGGSEYQNIMGMIKRGIKDEDVGEVAGFGFGMGTMEILVKVEGGGGAEKVEKIVRDSYPEAKYRIDRQSRR